MPKSKMVHPVKSAGSGAAKPQFNRVKIETYVPEAYAAKVRKAMGEAGAGMIGNYSFGSFSVTGTGRFLPGKGAKPAMGRVGKIESVKEEKIEARCERGRLAKVIKAIKAVHPYEEVVIDVHPLEEI